MSARTIPLLVNSEVKQLLLNAEQIVQEECCENQCEHYTKGKRPGDCPSFRAPTAGVLIDCERYRTKEQQ
jgi:hypothetical protein